MLDDTTARWLHTQVHEVHTTQMEEANKMADTKETKTKRSAATKKSGTSSGASKSSGSRVSGKGSAASSKKASAGPAAKSNGGSRKAASSNGKSIVTSMMETVSDLFKGGKPDAIDLLTKDHRVVDSLFAKVKANEDGNNRPVYKKIKAELDAHAHIEEKVFYPYLLEHGKKNLQKIVREGIEEHHQVKMFLKELEGLRGTSETFKAKLKVLIEDVEHHVKEEEDEMFKMVRRQIKDEDLQKLATKLQSEKQKYMKRASKSSARPAASRARTPAAAGA